ncbi:ubiquitin-conjugating enzyme [Rhodotorula toruloides]|uniref:Ubiquitin-conjugating enzyme n=1 Tax=Rhodotorula toruloides TaxID=5286 RepID=A0A511KK26_RHOTO|nr:ubiquitin-conjugating enzyme [Rhodotorula toruloides]
MANPARNKRLLREFQDIQRDTSGLKIEQVGDSLDHFVGSFPGPSGSPYEGGRFEVDIQPPLRYPFEPLKMKFRTKVYHPNISSATGYICLDILKTSWSPVFTLRTCLVSLQSLLSTPEPNDPQDAEVVRPSLAFRDNGIFHHSFAQAKHYLTDRRGFESTARYWTEVYATPEPSSTTHTPQPSRPTSANSQPAESPEKREARLAGLNWDDVQAFSEMGFPAEQVIDVLRRLNYRDGNKDKVGEDAVIQRLVG